MSQSWEAVAVKCSAEESDSDATSKTDGTAGNTTTFQAFATLVTCIIGAGVLGFPASFAKAGWLGSPVLLLFCAWAVIDIGHTLEDVFCMIESLHQAGETFSFERPCRYDDLCEAAFGYGSRPFAAIVVNGFLLLTCGAFMILVGQSLEFIVGISYVAGVLLAACILGLLSVLDDMTIFARLSLVGVVASVIYVLCIGCAGFQAAGFGTRKYMLMPETLNSLGPVVSVMFFGLSYQAVVPTLRAEMREPQELPWAINLAISVVAIIYLGAGFLGYYGWGDEVEGNILESMRSPDDSPMWEGLVLSIAVISNLLVTLPIALFGVYRAVEVPVGGYSPPLRLLVLVVALSVGLFVPYFLEFVELMSSVLGSFFVFAPIALYWALVAKVDSKISATAVMKHAVVVALGLISCVLGTWGAFVQLRAAIVEKPPW